MERAKELLKPFASPELLVRRSFAVGSREAELIYNPDLANADLLSRLLVSIGDFRARTFTAADLMEKVICVAECFGESDVDKVREGLLDGDAALVVDGLDEILVINIRKWDKRAVAEPPTSTVMRGPREGFIEDLKTNLSLIERRLRTPALAIEKMKIGRQSNTAVAIVYLSSVAAPETVKEVRERLCKIDIDALIDSHYVQPLLEDKPFSIFHQTGVTEKPDIVVGKLSEGRVAILVDGSPMAITVPFMLVEDYHSSEDYYERSSLATFLRMVRFVSVFFAILLPGLYVALEQYHYSVIPLRFLITVMTAVNGIPLSPLSEIIFVIMLFEIIREASVRMPRAVGMAMSIVGALVLGDTAVKAGIISSPAVMITALSSIALYTAPNQEGTLTLLRVAFTLLGGFGGMYLLILGSLYLLVYLSTLQSFGVPYTAPFAPFIPSDMKDSVYRASLLRMSKRPKAIKNVNETRQGEDNGSAK